MTDLNARIQTTEALKKQFDLHSKVQYPQDVNIDLDRLALLIDPTTTTKLYSRKKWIGPLLTWMRTSLVRVLYFIFRLDFSRLIELHQNVWLMAYHIQKLETRLKDVESELQTLKNKHT